MTETTLATAAAGCGESVCPELEGHTPGHSFIFNMLLLYARSRDTVVQKTKTYLIS